MTELIAETYAGRHSAEPETVDPVDPEPVPTTIVESADDALDEAITRVLEGKLAHFVADIERRYSQAREIETHTITGEVRQVHTEDLNIGRHMIDGYTVTANSPTGGSIAWTSVHVVYNGVDYTAADANTALKYVWFVKPGSGTAVTLSVSNTKPTLTSSDCLVFVNNGGTPVSALEASIPAAIGDASVDSGAIIAGAVGTTAIASGAVTATQLGSGAVTSAALGAGAVTAPALGAGAVTAVKLNTTEHVIY